MISESQSAFVLGRLITDNVLVAFKTMHCIDKRRKGKDVLMAIKLDTSKAYDRVEWGYLEAVMGKIGFHERWNEWMRICISTISYLMLINGKAKGKITLSRDLRQRDPISLYLFLLCVEGLSAMMRKEEMEGSIRGVAVSRGASKISHLFYADDSIIFRQATIDEGQRVLKILEDYERELG